MRSRSTITSLVELRADAHVMHDEIPNHYHIKLTAHAKVLTSFSDAAGGVDSQAVEHWEAALKISPLHPAGWFALGFGSLKLKDFTRAVRVSTSVPTALGGRLQTWGLASTGRTWVSQKGAYSLQEL